MIGCVVQARLSSQRLPGKVLLDLGGKPLIDWVVAAVGKTNLPFCVATSNDSSDDALHFHLESQGVPSFRGVLDDVLGRVKEAAECYGFNSVVRVSADSPFIEPSYILEVLGAFTRVRQPTKPLLATNIYPRTFPKGQSVEVLSASALKLLNRQATSPWDREHVTTYAYAHPNLFQILNVYNSTDEALENMAVDSLADLQRARQLVAARR